MHLTPQDLAEWEAAEGEWFGAPRRSEEHVEALVYHELAATILDARQKACRRAEERFRKAYAALLNARGEMLEAVRLAEDTSRLVALRREW